MMIKDESLKANLMDEPNFTMFINTEHDIHFKMTATELSRVRSVSENAFGGMVIKLSSVRKAIADSNSSSSGERRMCFSHMGEASFHYHSPLSHKGNG
jgi:hypothetical protein